MDDVRGLFLGMPHGTTPAAVTTNKNIVSIFTNRKITYMFITDAKLVLIHIFVRYDKKIMNFLSTINWIRSVYYPETDEQYSCSKTCSILVQRMSTGLA